MEKNQKVKSASRRVAVRRAKEFSKRRRLTRGLTLIVFAAFAAFFLFSNIFKPDKKFSENENRNLKTISDLKGNSPADGSFFEAVNEYYNDQFVFRDGFISLKADADVLTGKKEENGVVIGKDAYLFEKPVIPDNEALQKSIASINDFAQRYKDLNINLLVAPCASSVLKDKIPGIADIRDQNSDIKKLGEAINKEITFRNAYDFLNAHPDKYIYYCTDHHWTSDGAKYVFDGIAGDLGIEKKLNNYNEYIVTDTFRGTLASKSGINVKKDSIKVFEPLESDVEYYVRYSDTNEISASMFNKAALDKKDKYTVFFGGNHPLVEVHTTAQTYKNLLIFKDSYANSLIQFLYPYFEKIIIIDPRYYYDDIAGVIKDNDITDVLFCYSANILLNDTSLSDCISDIPSGT